MPIQDPLLDVASSDPSFARRYAIALVLGVIALFAALLAAWSAPQRPPRVWNEVVEVEILTDDAQPPIIPLDKTQD